MESLDETTTMYICPWKIYERRGVMNPKLIECELCSGYGRIVEGNNFYECKLYPYYLKTRGESDGIKENEFKGNIRIDTSREAKNKGNIEDTL